MALDIQGKFMGCWAIGSFGNDDAADWVADLTEQRDFSLVRETIAELLAVDGYLDAPYATQALAAIEVVAIALGRPTQAAQAEKELMTRAESTGPSADAVLVSQAIAAIDRITAPESELRELWEDTEDFDSWQADVAGLRAQLQA
jgi:hypothetical protein